METFFDVDNQSVAHSVKFAQEMGNVLKRVRFGFQALGV